MEVSKDKMHRLDILNNYDNWLLFRKIAFVTSGSRCTNLELEKVVKEIIQKSIKAIGGMLLYKSHYHEWKRITDNVLDEVGENDDTVLGQPDHANYKDVGFVELRNLDRLRKLGLHLVWDDEIGDRKVGALVVEIWRKIE
ncbi:unnamed protein product [Dovyalis caffra]|uniref:Uncharacterized protein n=1 Tax=Dovyalis caffra TaxID=77055 RepID=A0AAV1RQ29_9ROSI|nr:unnamed protein product [Dovyalis caffra]